MSNIKYFIAFATTLFFTTIVIAQIKPLYKYDIVDIDDYNGFAEYRLQRKKYFLHYNKISKGKDSIVYNKILIRENDTILNIKTEDITFFSILKKRYLFVSYYPKEQKGVSIGFSIRRLGKVDVIDLKYPTRRWYFNLDKDKGVSLDGIHDFKPDTGEIIFNYKFSIDTKNKSKPIPTHNYANNY
ncbi:hypothetical protein ACFQ1Q_04570 [Winogradskyella litorisediminis]|uniref:Uncharacterized protein n=1 Tax=Winogradskyella litorisediminis TaxID=1156618 RepID=A0ABW3N7T0_9FLAO